MKTITFSLFLIAILTFSIGCSTENPICSDNFCVQGVIFPKSELFEDEEFDTLPNHFTEQSLINLFTVKTPGDFEPVTITGKLDWDFFSEDWEYWENNVTYLKKVTCEINDEGEFGENRVLLVILNNDTVQSDADSTEHVEFLGIASVELTEWVNVGTFKGNIVGAPIKE